MGPRSSLGIKKDYRLTGDASSKPSERKHVSKSKTTLHKPKLTRMFGDRRLRDWRFARLAVCVWQLAVGSLRLAVCVCWVAFGGSWFAFGGWWFAFGGLRLAVCVLQFVVGGLRLTVGGLRFALENLRLTLLFYSWEFCGCP